MGEQLFHSAILSKRTLLSRLSPPMFQYAADGVAFGLSFLAYFAFRFMSGWMEFSYLPDIEAMLLMFVALSGYWLLLFWFSGLYQNWYARSPFDEFFTVIRITFIGCCVLLIVIFIDDEGKSARNSRLVIFLYWVFFTFAACCGRLLVRSLQRKLRERGVISLPALLAGTAEKLVELWEAITNAPALGFIPIGVVLSSADETEKWKKIGIKDGQTLSVLGTFSDFSATLQSVKPHAVLVATDSIHHDTLLGIVAECTDNNVVVKIMPDLYEIVSGQARTMQIYGTPLIEVSAELMKPWEEFAKRALDIVFSLLVLVIGAPFWLLAALAVKLDSAGPALYRQERVGKNGKHFMLYKFRSMRTDAEKHGPRWATMNDDRVTKIGRFYRKTHIDEVPQFWNVLRGEMSLVGPRPERPFFVEKFTKEIPYYPRRLKVRPGITGWHQVKYETYSETIEDVQQRLRYDFFYIENMSFKLDIEILVRTVFRVLKGHGQA